MIIPSDYALINSLNIKDLMIFYESMETCVMVEDMLEKHDIEQTKKRGAIKENKI